jgi:hypothetical protein
VREGQPELASVEIGSVAGLVLGAVGAAGDVRPGDVRRGHGAGVGDDAVAHRGVAGDGEHDRSAGSAGASSEGATGDRDRRAGGGSWHRGADGRVGVALGRVAGVVLDAQRGRGAGRIQRDHTVLELGAADVVLVLRCR